MTRMTQGVMREVDEGLRWVRLVCVLFFWFVVTGFSCALRIGLLFVC